MKILKNIIGFLMKIQLLFVLVVLFTSLVPHIWGIKPYVVLSGSMEPAIHTGSLAYVDKQYAYEELKVGDVIAYEPKEGTLVTHRIIAIENHLIETKGDNNQVSDGFSTNKKNYRGLTVGAIPIAGYFFRFISSKRGIILYVTIVTALFLMEYMLDYIKEKEEEENKRPNNKRNCHSRISK